MFQIENTSYSLKIKPEASNKIVIFVDRNGERSDDSEKISGEKMKTGKLDYIIGISTSFALILIVIGRKTITLISFITFFLKCHFICLRTPSRDNYEQT